MTHLDNVEYRDADVAYGGPAVPAVLSADGRAFDVPSQCPRCAAETVRTVRRGIPGGNKGLWRHDTPPPPLPPAVNVICACGYEHDKRPAASSETGCGAAWKVPLA